jgi:hypothetical protein
VLELGQASLHRSAPRRPENVSDDEDPQGDCYRASDAAGRTAMWTWCPLSCV